jgi:hypothetical protein
MPTPSEFQLLWRGLHPAAAALLALAAALWVILACRGMRRAAPRGVARAILGLRLAIAALAVLLVADVAAAFRSRAAGKLELLLLVDGSRSLGLADPHRPAQQLEAELAALRRSPAAPDLEALKSLSRIELARRVLDAPAAAGGPTLLEELDARFQVLPVLLDGGSRAPLPRAAGGGIELPEPTGAATDLGRPLVEAALGRPRESLAAVVLVSDGVHNQPGRPEEELGVLEELGVPLFTLGAGADEPPRDLRLRSIDGPRLVYRGDTLALAAVFEAFGLPASELSIEVRDGGDVIHRAAAELPASAGVPVELSVPLELELDGSGRRELLIAAAPVPGEASAANNSASFWLDAVDAKIETLYLDGGPRWEHRYLRDALEGDTTLSSKVLLVTRPPDRRLPAEYPRGREALFAYDAIILGDVPRSAFSKDDIANLRDFVTARGAGLIVIAGPGSMPYDFAGTPLEDVLPVSLRSPAPAGSEGAIAGGAGLPLALTPAGERSAMLRLDPDRERNRLLWSLLPAQDWRCPHAGPAPGAEALAAIGSAAAEGRQGSAGSGADAILVWRPAGAGKALFSAIDGTWRWRFRLGEELFQRFWRQAVRWAAADRLPPGDEHVRIGTGQARYEVPEAVEVRALVVDASGKALEGKGVRVDALIGLDGAEGGGDAVRVRLEAVPRSGGLHRGAIATGAGAGKLAAGTYRARIACSALPGYDARSERAGVRFVVAERPQLELDSPMRDRKRLADLAARGAPGGSYLPIESAARLLDLLPERRLARDEVRVIDAWSAPWTVLVLLAGLCTAEWLLRKRANLA